MINRLGERLFDFGQSERLAAGVERRSGGVRAARRHVQVRTALSAASRARLQL